MRPSDTKIQKKTRPFKGGFYVVALFLVLLALVEWTLLASPTLVSSSTTGEPVTEPRKAVVSGHKKDDPQKKRLERIVVLRLETHMISKKLLTEIREMKEKEEPGPPEETPLLMETSTEAPVEDTMSGAQGTDTLASLVRAFEGGRVVMK